MIEINKREDYYRLKGWDLLRGVAMILVIFTHTAIYNYDRLSGLDFNHPPLAVALLSIIALWGGLFFVYSLTVNFFQISRPERKSRLNYYLNFWLLAGFFYLICHFLLIIILGRWGLDLSDRQINLSMMANFFRYGQFILVDHHKWFEGSSLLVIAWNLIIFGSFVKLALLIKVKIFNQKFVYLLLSLGLFSLMLPSLELTLSAWLDLAFAHHNYFLIFLLSPWLASPYPLLSYLPCAFFGASIGLSTALDYQSIIKRIIIPIGLVLLIIGFVAMIYIGRVRPEFGDFFYFKILFELGIYIISVVWIASWEKIIRQKNVWPIVIYFSRISLTVYLLETLLSEFMRWLLNYWLAGWSNDLTGCLIFGLLNVVVWSVILIIWSRNNFKYSLEYWYVKLVKRLGLASGKL